MTVMPLPSFSALRKPARSSNVPRIILMLDSTCPIAIACPTSHNQKALRLAKRRRAWNTAPRYHSSWPLSRPSHSGTAPMAGRDTGSLLTVGDPSQSTQAISPFGARLRGEFGGRRRLPSSRGQALYSPRGPPTTPLLCLWNIQLSLWYPSWPAESTFLLHC